MVRIKYKIIRMPEDVSALKAFNIARGYKKFREMTYEETKQTEYIFISGKTVSDLIIRERKTYRKCTDKEWTRFFYSVLCPPPPPIPGKNISNKFINRPTTT